MIYILETSDGKYIKVGFTDKPIEQRVKGLQTGSANEINVVVLVPGSMKQEKAIHKALKVVLAMITPQFKPFNEWYPSGASIFRYLIDDIKLAGVDHAINALNLLSYGINALPLKPGDTRNVERELRKMGLSKKDAMRIISKNKKQSRNEWEGKIDSIFC